MRKISKKNILTHTHNDNNNNNTTPGHEISRSRNFSEQIKQVTSHECAVTRVESESGSLNGVSVNRIHGPTATARIPYGYGLKCVCAT